MISPPCFTSFIVDGQFDLSIASARLDSAGYDEKSDSAQPADSMDLILHQSHRDNQRSGSTGCLVVTRWDSFQRKCDILPLRCMGTAAGLE